MDLLNLIRTSTDQITENESNLFANLPADLAPATLTLIKSLYIDWTYLKSFLHHTLEVNDSFVSLLVSLLTNLKDHLDHIYNFNGEPDVLSTVGRHLFTEIFYQINLLSFESKKFISKFHKHQGLKVLFACLNNKNLVDQYVQFYAQSSGELSQNLDICDSILRRNIGTLVCLAKSFGTFKQEWKECDAVKSLLFYLEKTKHIYDNRIYTTMAIALVSSDSEIDSIPEVLLCLPEIIDMIKDCATRIASNQGLTRTVIEIDDLETGDVVTSESCFVTVGDTEWALINLLSALYHMTVNDKIKKDIYYTYEVGQYLKSIIFAGNFTEKEFALNALWQLCFNEEIARDVWNDEELIDLIRELSGTKEHTNVCKKASGIVWLLDKKMNVEEIDTQKTLRQTVEKYILPSQISQHIMISYNRQSRDLCLLIKAELEKKKFKVWIDVEDISGSSLESMANAIENSFCILVCMTEKYKQSPNCRVEGEYAFQLNRPIIPLIMQPNYKPDGWLGIILGSKIYINFTQDFNECINSLDNEVAKVLDADKGTKLTSLTDTSCEILGELRAKLVTQELSKKFKLNSAILDWSEKEVENWLIEKNIHPVIIENLNSFNGKVLSELFLMKDETPKFFYESIAMGNQAKHGILLKDMAMFTFELKKLFLIN